MNISTSPIRTLSAPNEQAERTLSALWTRPPGLIGWLCSTNHKDIGRRYIVMAFIFFGLAGLLAAAMRIHLAFPENHFLGPDLYNQFFTVHGTTMMFLFAVPILEGLGLYFVPLMVGTRNAAFPRLNAFGYYTFLAGGLLLWGGLLVNAGADAGWFAYAPLSGPQYSPGHRVDIWADMITLTEISALSGAVVNLTTVFKQRAPGMSLTRIPLFVWAQVVTSFMILFAMPAVMLVSGYLAMDRLANVNTHFFNPAEGGDALLYQHLFWFFGHPEVYIIFIPATGMVSMIVETFSGRRVFGYPVMVLSLIATAFIGFCLWVHHSFATPIPLLGRSLFSAAVMRIAIHILGLHGMTRRIYTYVAETGWGNLNLLATIGAGIIGVSVLLFVINVAIALGRSAFTDANPWLAPSLEWATGSPPPAYNFYNLPSVSDAEPLWHSPEEKPVVVGLSTEKREVLNTTVIDAVSEHRYELATDSIWPLALAIVVGLTMTFVIFTPWAIPAGMFFSLIVLYAWFCRGNQPKFIVEAAKPKPQISAGQTSLAAQA